MRDDASGAHGLNGWERITCVQKYFCGRSSCLLWFAWSLPCFPIQAVILRSCDCVKDGNANDVASCVPNRLEDCCLLCWVALTEVQVFEMKPLACVMHWFGEGAAFARRLQVAWCMLHGVFSAVICAFVVFRLLRTGYQVLFC